MFILMEQIVPSCPLSFSRHTCIMCSVGRSLEAWWNLMRGEVVNLEAESFWFCALEGALKRFWYAAGNSATPVCTMIGKISSVSLNIGKLVEEFFQNWHLFGLWSMYGVALM